MQERIHSLNTRSYVTSNKSYRGCVVTRKWLLLSVDHRTSRGYYTLFNHHEWRCARAVPNNSKQWCEINTGNL